jgi:hypothetical protein
MHECFIHCHKNEKIIFSIKIPWWFSVKLQNEYDFEDVILGGELDFHLTVTGAILKEIHESNPPSESGIEVPMHYRIANIKKVAFIEGQIDTIIRTADVYDKIEIVLWYVINCD